MVPVIIIAVVFTGLAAFTFWAAPRGRLAPITNLLLSQNKGAKAGMYTLFAVTYVGFGFVIPAIFLIGNHNRAKSDVNGVKLTSAEVQGRQLFGEHCAVCHTLAAASAVGQTGPNLDQIKPSVGLITSVLNSGLTGPTGTMPADVVQGQDATDVAQFVAAVAGHR